jgi:hypothetical protein
MTNPMPTRLEIEALTRSISQVENLEYREALLKQVNAIQVTDRRRDACGFYVDFTCADSLHISDMTDHFNETPPTVAATHPEVEDALFFIVYVKGGQILFMEGASTSAWPDNEELIVFEALGSRAKCASARS